MSSTPVPLSLPVVSWALRDAFFKLNPFSRLRNPVIFIVATCACMVTITALHDLWTVGAARRFDIQISLWLWLTVLSANFAEALGEVRERVRADNLRRSRQDALATRLSGGKVRIIPASKLRTGDIIVVKTGELIPVDGELIDGIATVDESTVTGESAPVIRESGSDQTGLVTSGSRVLSGELRLRVTSTPAETLVEKMISALETTTHEATRDEITLQTFTSGVALICVVGAAVLFLFARLAADTDKVRGGATVAEGAAWLTTMLPITIAALLSTTGAAGMGRLVQRNVLAINRRAFESMYDLTTVFLDKTGTVTGGNRKAVEFVAFDKAPIQELALVAALASVGDDTPEGRSTVELAEQYGAAPEWTEELKVIPFSAYTRMSGIDIKGRALRKGAADAIADYVKSRGGLAPDGYSEAVKRIASGGGTPLGVSDGTHIIGIIHLKDEVKPGLREEVEKMRAMGIRTVLITGDNPLTTAAIAREIGVDEFIAQATPADKLAHIKRRQDRGEVIAMAGDETNDAPALAQADVGIVMDSGTTAAKEAGHLLDLDSDPTKIVEMAAIARSVRATRLSLMSFSFAVGASQCLLILPALIAPLAPSMEQFNFLGLHSAHSAVLSSAIFKVGCVLAMLPVAWNGAPFWPVTLRALLRRNVVLFGGLGLILPIPGLWLLDRLLVALRLGQ